MADKPSKMVVLFEDEHEENSDLFVAVYLLPGDEEGVRIITRCQDLPTERVVYLWKGLRFATQQIREALDRQQERG